jgi:folate-binding protein YgfZ
MSDSLQLFQHTSHERDDTRLAIRRVDLLGKPGYLLATNRTNLARLWKSLILEGVSPGGAAAFHACRIESGFPLYGLDLSDKNLAQEAARTERAISLTKGCYLGQEPIARLDALGHVNRELRALRLASEPAPEPGDVVASDEGREIGVVTSSATHPGEKRPIALGFLRSSHTKPDTAVRVRVGRADVPATVFWPR